MVSMRYLQSRPRLLLVILAVVFLTIDMWGHITRTYVTSPYIDIATHLLFGAWLALALIYRNNLATALFVFTFVMLTGIGWELLEFTYDQLFAAPRNISLAQHGALDTLKDLASNTVGAAILLFLFRKRANHFVHPVVAER
jgi:hypothetical protein